MVDRKEGEACEGREGETYMPLALYVPEAQRKDLGGNLYLLLEARTHLL